MTHDDTHPDWFAEQLPAYVAGGLTAAERLRIEQLADASSVRRAELEEMMTLDASLSQAAGVAAVVAGLEDRLSAALPARRWLIAPAARRAMLAAAACAALATVGYFGSQQMAMDRLWGWNEPGVSVGQNQSQSNLSQIGRALNLYANEEKGVFPRTYFRGQSGAAPVGQIGDAFLNEQKTRDSEAKFIAPSGTAEADSMTAKNVQYSFANVYPSSTRVGQGYKTFITSFDSTFAVAADIAPKPAPDAAQVQHHSDGQNVLYADGHAELPSSDSVPLVDSGDVDGDGMADQAKKMPSFADNAHPFKPGDLALAKPAAGASERAREIVNTAGTVVLGGALKQTAAAAPSMDLSDAKGMDVLAANEVKKKGEVGTAADQPVASTAANAVDTRKIIRTGEMEFEVDRFDSAAAVVGKIVADLQGFVATTNSDKLDNGKVRGAVVLRVPPGNLDTLVMQLRALGDLKSQRIGSADVTKEYTDLDSELRADRAMETRLLDLIKNGKGEIKDLLAAEKELAEWRGKIEKILGQMKYFDNQIALSTLTITLTERDIHTPAATVEQETISAGIEADDVEKTRTAALQILAEAKARVVSADLKKLDAGQMASTIVADIPPDGSGPTIDRLKLLGKVARLEATKAQTADPNAPATASTKIDHRDSRLTLSLYNVANVAPRQSTTVNLAVSDVAGAYARIAAQAKKAGGRVVSGGATQQATPDASRANTSLEIPADAADAFLLELGQVGQVVSSSTTENPDTNNVTTSKRGFAVSIFPSAALPPVQTASLRVETGDVEQSAASVTAAILAAGGHVIGSSTDVSPAGMSTANLSVDVPLDKNAEAINLVRGAGKVLAATSQQNAAAPVGPLARTRLDIAFTTASPLAGDAGGLIANLRNGFALSAKGLLYSLQMVVIGLCFILPWALVLMAVAKVWKRRKARAVVV